MTPATHSPALRVLIAPDCFGDSLTAAQATGAIAAGWGQARPPDTLVQAPQSDGGPGFIDVLAGRVGEVRSGRVLGPLQDQVTVRWVWDSGTAYIECAQACGLALLGGPPTVATALAAHSVGVGQSLGIAIAAGATRIVVGLGGSACTDGGRGLVDALGGLVAARHKLSDIEVIVATDVEHPLLGPMGAAPVFGPQKGADPQTVEVLVRRLTAWADELNAFARREVSAEPGAGAAGGIGAALLALGGHRAAGAAVIAEHTGLAADIAAADLIITGEGRFDDQSLHGKVISALAAGAAERHTPVLVLAGQVQLGRDELRAAGIVAAHSIVEHAGSVELAIADAANQLTGLAERIALGWDKNRE
jgi:glycerate 2-kinase